MVEKSTWHDEWGNVDQVKKPEFFVKFIDLTRIKWNAMARADPEGFYAFLDIKNGNKILDIGCGTGVFLRPLAESIDPSCRIVGVDNSEIMINEAIKRAEGLNLPVEYRVGDAHALDFAAESFDRCYANFVLMHLESPKQALSEMKRVLRPGGLIVVDEPDWDSQVINSKNLQLTRRIVHFISDSLQNGIIGRQLTEFYHELGLVDIEVSGQITTWPNYPVFKEWWIEGGIDKASSAGIASREELADWLQDLDERDKTGRFFSAFTAYRVSGRKP
ncbi:putative UbiE/COQ5 methyltransferase [uncultured Desulfobacterium sp.]|uniref:Putative UbiE/COQ5 methyltransferase n=1 Tax=uncultured Desulfobacterium sp. TaxID=201089 RepID=A0A445MZS0_9BACT|nr:putative UbiE/COQ5 methyltransferase [uncultured Desulfobacterium sp.]